ncbi:hypothetical protein NM688_g646 [Phlebia brevispora]|uniref:Uncharacterized protein n=1 Tax=Phlebia brevispora TaxID=194682 RepID=A0ACC1TDV1_9APHY|nr:hypothetical protein NM688_g646 [Phlebia brevispora]
MPFLSSSGLWIICILLVATVYVRLRSRSSRKRLPPGPRGLPVLGNIHQFSPLRPYLKFREWAFQYGEIFRIRVGPQEFIVLNSSDAADELLANRSKIYSSRVAPHVAHDLMSAGQRMLFMSYNEKAWKVSRKYIQGAVGPASSSMERFCRFADLEAVILLHDLLRYDKQQEGFKDGISTPSVHTDIENHWFSLVRRYTTSLVMTLTYGKRVSQIQNNPRVHKIYEVVEKMTQVAQPGHYLADAFPIMRKLPDALAPWRKEGRKLHNWEMELWGGLLAEQQALIRSGVHGESFVSAYLTARAEAGLENLPGRGVTDDGWMRDELLTYNAATILEAGSDTTASGIQAFVLFMLNNPHTLQKAREEIDRVVGETRLPSFEDEAKLPYFVACIKETLRRHSAIIGGVPHKVDEDDTYKGYFIPKGSIVLGNTYAIHMDPVRYPNPDVFTPERFHKPTEPTRWGSGPDSTDRDHYAFGWGRRYCPGAHIAEWSMFVVCARLLWAFDFRNPSGCSAPDANDELGTWSDGFLCVPKMFAVEWKVRSEAKEKLILQKLEDAQEVWILEGLSEVAR